MLREIRHFIRSSKVLMKEQKRSSRAEFSDWLTSTADEQGYADVRRELVGDLSRRVLEIGCGTGAMFSYYAADARVTAIEPEEDFLALALARAERSAGRISAARGDGMRLEFADASFDAVVFGMVLCSVPSVERVLAEAHRVLAPGGALRALEHVRSEAPGRGLLMDVTNPLWMKLNRQGCRWNRNPIADIEAAGFQLDDIQSFKRFDTILPAFPMRRVRAHKRASGAPAGR